VSLAPIPITVVAGYLGAGKTTLLRHLVRTATSRRLVLAVDDFGHVNFDDDDVQGCEHDLLRFDNGCFCCTLGAELAGTLCAIRDGPHPPVHVVIEASGIADPRTIAQCGHLPGFRLDGTIVVADAETIRLAAVERHAGIRIRQQLRSADLLVLNKIDLVPPRERTAVVQWLHALAPGAQVVEASHARLPTLVLLGSHRADDARLERRTVEAAQGPEFPPHHGTAYERWSWAGPGPMREAAFGRWVAALPRNVLRAKGVLSLSSDPVHRFLFQHLGSRWSVRRHRPWGPEPPGCRVTLIALAGTLNAEHLERSIGLCAERVLM
jgi:G3E family GTPase